MGFKGLHCTECAKVEYNEEYANPFRPEPVPGTPIPAVSYLDSWDVEKDDEARYQGSILSQHALQWWKSLPTSPAVDPARPAWYL